MHLNTATRQPIQQVVWESAKCRLCFFCCSHPQGYAYKPINSAYLMQCIASSAVLQSKGLGATMSLKGCSSSCKALRHPRAAAASCNTSPHAAL